MPSHHVDTGTALAATQSIRRSRGYRALSAGERAAFDRDLARIEAVLQGRPASPYGAAAALADDPYAVHLETPLDLLGPGGGPPGPARPGGSPPPGLGVRPGRSAPPARPAPRPAGTEVLGERARRALDAVDFPSFVAGLIQGTFQAIVDATAQQVREYARLVADLSKSIDEFSRDNVTGNQARDYLVGKHPRELKLVLPEPGQRVDPFLDIDDDADESPAWLSEYGLDGETLTPELAEGALLTAGRRVLAQERMQTLATMVLVGVNRIVVDDGQLRARLQFHARAREKTSAEVVAQTGGQQLGIAGRQAGLQSAVTTMVSTVDVNAQSDVSIKADLVGEVAVRFRTETFDLNSFADTQAITLINRHALVRNPSGTQTTPPASPPAETKPEAEE